MEMVELRKDMEQIPKSVDELLLEFKELNSRDNSSKIKFLGLNEEKDVYNITAPFEDGGEIFIAGRVESRDSEKSKVVFFQKSENGFYAREDMATLELQDPFITKISGELVLGGVEVFEDNEKPGELNYRTIFYKGSSIQGLKRFSKGPDRMKDIRLCELEDHRILVMTRPQGELGGRGKIGYTILNSLEELNLETILKAKVLNNQFIPEEWGGCNELHLLGDGRVGILAHVAKYGVDGERHYYAAVFCLDYENGTYSSMKIIGVRDNFAEGPAKRKDLMDVIFSGGLVRRNGKAQLYCGVSDTEGHMITICDPFLPFQQ